MGTMGTMTEPLPRFRCVAAAVLLIAGLGCASFDPVPMEQVPFRERSVTQQRGPLTVTVAVPSTEEAEKIFGVDLAERLVQPVWIEVENTGAQDLWFM